MQLGCIYLPEFVALKILSMGANRGSDLAVNDPEGHMGNHEASHRRNLRLFWKGVIEIDRSM